MASFITFEAGSIDRIWSSANWVFNAFLDDVLSTASSQSDMVEELRLCKYHQNVDLEELARRSPELHVRVVSAFAQTVSRIAQGGFHIRIEDRELTDDNSRQQYQQAISELAQQLSGELPA